MSPLVHHECIRVPVTALAAVGPLLLAAEGPLVRFYLSPDARQFRHLASQRIFTEQAVHGIATHESNSDRVIFAIWGGPFVRFLEISHPRIRTDIDSDLLEGLQLSSVVKVSDWILDLDFCSFDKSDASEGDLTTCAAVMAHNALIQLTLQRVVTGPEENGDQKSQVQLLPHFSELTSSSRSILYSAHLLWDSADHILVAAGTAFGEIMYWSWTKNADKSSSSCIHRVFLGHEGSIFGVRISNNLQTDSNPGRRYLASCSDDRTIRIWDLSDIPTVSGTRSNADVQSEDERSRHTGFSNDLFDAETSNTPCLAMGWGHLSRVWAVNFLGSQSGISLLSSGEDATSRIWQFTPPQITPGANAILNPFTLEQRGIAVYHSGKNIWSTALLSPTYESQQVVCGAADSKISAYRLPKLESLEAAEDHCLTEYTLQDIISLSRSGSTSQGNPQVVQSTKKSKADDFFRSYAFLDSTSFLLTTNAGKVFLETLATHENPSGFSSITESKLVQELDEGSGNSVCATESSVGVGFVAGARGGIYMYQKGGPKLRKIHTVRGKVGSLFTSRTLSGEIVLLITLMGQKVAQLLYIATSDDTETIDAKTVKLAISESETGTTITSMAFITTEASGNHVVLGFRGGTVAVYVLPDTPTSENDEVNPSLIERAHGKETVTSMLWYPAHSTPTEGHLVSVGRDGCCAIHYVDLCAKVTSKHHFLPLPVGPNIEGVYDHHGHLIMYGFSSTKFIVYDITVEEEIMSVETGGSHRSWSFHPHSNREGGGTLVWTRASTMHVYTQHGPNHQVIRSGGHGREIKSVAVSNGVGSDRSRRLIATGAEDTDIKIFEYVDGDLVCRRTLRKHKTGIQHLQWSDDGEYLFSSGGCEEFYIWRMRVLPSFIGVGVHCEAVCKPESEHSDLRIMSFDVRRGEAGFVIGMVYSDSNIRVYNYNPAASEQERWHTIAQGVYFTSCLTQCVFLSPNTIMTAGTDGHAVVWPLLIESATVETVKWRSPARIHQNTSKALDTCILPNECTLVVSGGDDGSLSFLLTSAEGTSYAHPPIIVVRTHASAITACAIIAHQGKFYVMTSGNDQWIRLWEVTFNISHGEGAIQDPLTIRRAGKLKSHVADVSSMAVLEASGEETKVLICGVGMEVLRLDFK